MHNVFSRELAIIDNEYIRSFVIKILDYLPTQFWTKPASSTGKYHPQSSLGQGGLVRHTKQVFWVAKTIMDTKLYPFVNFNVVLAACLLHDGFKYYGQSFHTNRFHAALAVEKIDEFVAKTNPFIDVFPDGSNPDWYYSLLNCIQSHNGRFTSEFSPHPADYTDEQKLVHVADMIASRPFLNFEEEKCPRY